MRFWHKTANLIDLSTEYMGWIGWFLVLYCMAFGFTGVVLRYVFNSPSLWIGPTIQAAMVLMACFGGPYALKHGAFIKLDLFYANFSAKKKATFDIITVFFTFIFLGVLIWYGIAEAQYSFKFKQVTPTVIPIPLYPIKAVIPISGIFTLLVVLKLLIHDFMTILDKGENKL